MSVQSRRATPGIALAVVMVLASQQPSWGGSLETELRGILRTKNWVTVLNRYTRSEGLRIIAKIGETERLIYRAQPSDGGIGPLALSPSGEKLAFGKGVKADGDDQVRLKLCIIDVDGSNYAELLDLAALARSDLAWSHDQHKLAFVGALRKGLYGLFVLDITLRPVVVLVDRPLPSGKSFINLTSQAWAPDNERLVYVDAQGHMVVLNVVTGAAEDLGPGNVPTWSPDGGFVAYRADAFGQPPGDYFLLPMAPRGQPMQLLSNRGSGTGGLASQWYLGPPLWSPDSRFLLIMRLVGPGESQQPHLLEVQTRRVGPLPIGSMGDMRSWGGKR